MNRLPCEKRYELNDKKSPEGDQETMEGSFNNREKRRYPRTSNIGIRVTPVYVEQLLLMQASEVFSSNPRRHPCGYGIKCRCHVPKGV